MRRLIWGFAGRTYHIVGNLMLRLIYLFFVWICQQPCMLTDLIWFGASISETLFHWDVTQHYAKFPSTKIYNTNIIMSQCIWFPTMWYVRPAKPQISLRILAVWSEPLLVAWVFYDCLATDLTPFGVSKLKMRLRMLVWVYLCQNVTLLEILCTGSIASNRLSITQFNIKKR